MADKIEYIGVGDVLFFGDSLESVRRAKFEEIGGPPREGVIVRSKTGKEYEMPDLQFEAVVEGLRGLNRDSVD